MASSSSPLIRPNNPHHQSYDSIVTPSAIADEELTEEELAEYERGIISWSRATRHDFWFRREWFWGYIVSIALIILVTLMTIFHHRVSIVVNHSFLWFLWLTADHRMVDAVRSRVAEAEVRLAHANRLDLPPQLPAFVREW